MGILVLFFTTQCSDCSHSARKHKSSVPVSIEGRKKGSEQGENNIESYFNVIDADKNIIKVRKGRQTFYVQLLGINPTNKVESYLGQYVGSRVRLIFDSYRRFSRIRANDIVRAYVTSSSGECLNSRLLKERISLFNKEFIQDSIQVYHSYVNSQEESPGANDSRKFSIGNIRASTFRVDNFNSYGNAQGFGTGFFITNTGIGISNYHVFDNGSQWQLTLCSDNQTHDLDLTNILHYDPDLDYILFQVPNLSDNSFIPHSNNEIEQGNEIFVYGNPKGLSCTLSKGIISAIRDKDNDGINELIQIDAAISPGNSGGPVTDKYGAAIGIATMKFIDCENCNFSMNLKALEIEKYISK